MATATKTPHPTPVMRITRFDRVNAWMISLIMACLVGAFVVFLMWYSSRIPVIEAEMIVEPMLPAGGEPDGAIDETLKVDSPEDISDDPSEAELPSEETQIVETLETVVELSDNASQFVQDQFQEQLESTGKPGRAEGSGKPPLGEGGGEGAISRAQRWVVRFGEKDTLEEYADQLDFFKIEFGAILGDEIVYVSNFSASTPTVRREKISDEEQRLYMQWQNAGRRKSDVELMKKAGVNAASVPILHFYPAQTESLLAQKEKDYRKRDPREIRRTYFSVSRRSQGYTFIVTRQIYLR
ncbi:MAG: hypothetical protein KDA65_15305 [Planctomycetaceae bacterium]|nr:hypothetical protein [Planctomycetaceae bacterium]